MKKAKKTEIKHEVEGEGSHSSDAAYRERTKDFMEKGKVRPAAEQAKRAVEGPERGKLERAEKKAKAKRKSDDV